MVKILITWVSNNQVGLFAKVRIILVKLIYQRLYHVCVLGVQVEGLVERLESQVICALLFVDLANHYMNRGLLGHQMSQLFKHLQGFLESFQSHQNGALLVLV